VVRLWHNNHQTASSEHFHDRASAGFAAVVVRHEGVSSAVLCLQRCRLGADACPLGFCPPLLLCLQRHRRRG